MRAPPPPQDRPVRICPADANVLYSRSLRDYLLCAMRARLIAVRWSVGILGELTEHLMKNREGFTQDSADRLGRGRRQCPRRSRCSKNPPGPSPQARTDQPTTRRVFLAAAAVIAISPCRPYTLKRNSTTSPSSIT
ncbi:MAG: hypothetical protein LBS27_01195 [Bifidobacteriaceae bacterium]|nr:hypothetical protein [Bifidobacteriaceae bacterium]